MVLNHLRVFVLMKPTFQELSATLVTLLLLAITGVVTIQGTPMPEYLVGFDALAIGFTFGVRSGRTEEHENPTKGL